jgi:hypothetical protein
VPHFLDEARDILAKNDRGGFTVPTDKLYPFQWNWDSAFVAMGFATYDMDRALQELESLVRGQWADGMIPHIIFHTPSDTYFPGPDVWGTVGLAHTGAIPSSGITQPPVFAIALAFIFERGVRAAFTPRMVALYRAALAYHRWFAAARDPDGTGLVATLHNWETGRDNSVEWDGPFAAVSDTTVTEIRRKDLGHVDAAMRPRDEDYRRYIHLVDTYRAAGWNPAAMWKAAPFKVADVGTNAILLAAEGALLKLAAQFGTAEELEEIAARIARMEAGIQKLWHREKRAYVSWDLIADKPIPIRVSAGYLPLMTDAPNPMHRKAMLAQFGIAQNGVALPLPSTAPDEPGFESKRYWRGPVWAVVNWLVARGLDYSGAHDGAHGLRKVTLGVIRENGFSEYFDPITKEGLGGPDFSWTAAIALLMAEEAGV